MDDNFVMPMLLYGYEIRGYEKLDHNEMLYKRFLKRFYKKNNIANIPQGVWYMVK